MKTGKVTAFGAIALFSLLWMIPLSRALSFYQWARECDVHSTINSSNDLRFSSALLASYTLSLITGFAFAWFLSRQSRLAFFSFMFCGVLVVLDLVRISPEGPIHLIPTMWLWRPFDLTLATGVAITVILKMTPKLTGKMVQR